MKETGILFTPENIRAIREGRKTQTRRVMKSQWTCDNPDSYTVDMALRHCQYGVPGDRLYIKEGIIRHASIPQLVGYYMDGCRVTEHWEKRSTAMFMPKWAARTWLELTDVRAERLQDISEEDAIAEGITEENVIVGANCNGGIHHEETADRYFFDGGDDEGYTSAVYAYEVLWDSINKKKHPWSSNPWCWRLTFKRIKA